MRRHRRTELDFVVDVTPVMSLVVHLIPMLLLAVRFAVLAQHATDAPPARAAATDESDAPPPTRPEVRIGPEGLSVRGPGVDGVLLPCAAPCGTEGYDYAALTQILSQMKALVPTERTMVVVPGPDVPYATLVRVFDASAGDAGRTFFPEPMLVAGG